MATVGVNGLMFYRTSLKQERTMTLLSDCTKWRILQSRIQPGISCNTVTKLSTVLMSREKITRVKPNPRSGTPQFFISWSLRNKC